MAIEKSSPEERAAFLEEACGCDRELRAQDGSLLRAHENPDRFLDQPPLGDQPTENFVAATDRDMPLGPERRG